MCVFSEEWEWTLVRRTGRVRMKFWGAEEHGGNEPELRYRCPGTSAGLRFYQLKWCWQDSTWWKSIVAYEWRRRQFQRSRLCLLPVGQASSLTFCVLAGEGGGGNKKFQFPCHWDCFQHFRELWASLSSRISFIPGTMTLYFHGHQRHLFSTQVRMVRSLGQSGLKCEVMHPYFQFIWRNVDKGKQIYRVWSTLVLRKFRNAHSKVTNNQESTLLCLLLVFCKFKVH